MFHGVQRKDTRNGEGIRQETHTQKQGPTPSRHQHLWHAHARATAEIDGGGSKAVGGNVDASVGSPQQTASQKRPHPAKARRGTTHTAGRGPHGGSQPKQGNKTTEGRDNRRHGKRERDPAATPRPTQCGTHTPVLAAESTAAATLADGRGDNMIGLTRQGQRPPSKKEDKTKQTDGREGGDWPVSTPR